MTAYGVQATQCATALQNIEAEQALLGALMQDNRLLDEVSLLLKPEDFFEPLHGRLFEDMLQRRDNGEQINPPLLKPAWGTDPALTQLGGIQYLVTLSCNTAALFGARDFAKQIADLAGRRRLREQLEQAIRRLDSGTAESAAKVSSEIEAVLVEAQTPSSPAAVTVSAADSVDAVINEILEVKQNGTPPGIVLKDLPEWTELLGPMRPTEFTLLAGRPGMGKTGMAIKVATSAAKQGHGVIYFSHEMQHTELMMRAVADLMFRDSPDDIPFRAIQRAELSTAQIERIARLRDLMESWPLIIHDEAGMTMREIQAACRRHARRLAKQGKSLDLVIIDHLQLVRPESKRGTGYESMTEVSRATKTLAKNIRAHVLALSQMSRKVEEREDKRPQLADLRDSGALEEDANNVVMLYREEYYVNKEAVTNDGDLIEKQRRLAECQNLLEIYARKVRNGGEGTRTINFFTKYQAIRSADHRSAM